MSMTPSSDESVKRALDHLMPNVSERPHAGLILGSGWGGFAQGLTQPRVFEFRDIPGFPSTTVAGHSGRLVLGRLDGLPIAAMQGRLHYYEGHAMATVALPLRVLAGLGVEAAVLTAAVGGIRADLRAGDLVCLCDHLNLTGQNPLRGPDDDPAGSRFVDMTHAYDGPLRQCAAEAAQALGIELTEAVYAALPGPSYETPAEIRMLRALGADVVGMSIVAESIVARQLALPVLALALVTNVAAGLSDDPIRHSDVLAAGALASERGTALLGAILKRFARPSRPG